MFAALAFTACASSRPWYIQAGLKASCGPPDHDEAVIVLDPGWNDGKLRVSAPAAEPGRDADDASIRPPDGAPPLFPAPPGQLRAGDPPAPGSSEQPPPAEPPAAGRPGAGS